ncbi:unnamed protein product [Thelazia callipaeda]|uniref:Secreted protein n=1 Tax=Thelazia callipaeda TaxID=103827 RepID=A0A0N5DAB5_THECL|nr:unnamed protein product [Thelazia callipaeda]
MQTPRITMLFVVLLTVDSCQGNIDTTGIICLQVPKLWFCKPPAKEPPEVLPQLVAMPLPLHAYLTGNVNRLP